MFTALTKFSNYFTDPLRHFVCSSLFSNSKTIAAIYRGRLCQAMKERLYIMISENPPKNAWRQAGLSLPAYR